MTKPPSTTSVPYEELFELSPDMYISVDAASATIKVCNQTVADTVGFSKAELLGSPVFDLYHPDCIPEVKKAFQQFVSTGSIRNWELALRTKDGGKVPVLLSVRAVRNASGEIDHSISTLRDITNLKHIEHLEEVNRKLERSNDELEQFAYVVSHDLQEPIRMVTAFTELLELELGESATEDAKKYMKFARDGGRRMQQLVEDLLAYSRIGRDERIKQVNSQELVQTVLGDLKLSLAECDAEVVVGELPTVAFDRTALWQVFTNLIGNALKFRGDRPPVIRVDATREEDMWKFSVDDNGIGIDPAYEDKVFRMFQRLHARESYEGTGIGLAICRKSILGRGGKIWIEQKQEPGTTFCFTIPATESAAL